MIEALDLTRHAVFEASAGTGKTHAIGDIVLRLLSEQRCRLDKILLVTFTEKATGELKDRLRRRIEDAIRTDSAKAAILQPELDRFDRAAISTIHGFCTRVLQDYAADLGQDFQFELVDDELLRTEALRDIQRKDWPTAFGERLHDVLAAAGYDRQGALAWENCVLKIVSAYRPESGHRLLPDPSGIVPPEYELLAFTIARLRERMGELKRQRGVMSFDDIIGRVAAGLDPARNPRAAAVSAAIREQYSFAIVDEFQDTDDLQWSIFRRLFLDGPETRLIVVGDPKQAIYSFRGADLPTYIAAVNEMRENRNAVSCPLVVNWRSTPEMIDALNALFERGEFFPPGGISYVPVSAPAESLRRTGVTRDLSERQALTIVDVDGPEKTSMKKARAAFADFVAAESGRLLKGDRGRPLLHIKTATGSRPINAADLCLLLPTRGEAAEFTAALRRRNIPYSFYRYGKIRQTVEATDITRILRTLAHPDEERRLVRALFTIFFRVPPAEILATGGVAANHPARLRVQAWRVLAGERKWSELFTSMLEDTGVLFVDHGSAEYDRRIANLKLLLGRLQFAGYQRSLDLFELLELHENFSPDPERETDDPPMETDEPRVRIMTMHSAKGLEFPVVFWAPRFSDPRDDGDVSYRDDEGRLIFDLALLDKDERKKGERAERIRAQDLDEQRRLAYVALTRAQAKLYVPFMHAKKVATRSPLVALIAPALERSGLLQAPTLAGCVDGFAERPGEMAPPSQVEADRVDDSQPLRLATLFPEFDAGIGRRRTVVQSFTSMHRAAKREHVEAFGDRPDRLNEVHEPAVAVSDPFRGAIFGEMVHEVFERLNFSDVEAARNVGDLATGETGRLIAEQVARFLPRLVTRGLDERVRELCRSLLGTMVWNALRTPLGCLGDMLCRLRADDCLQELEFLYPRTQREGGGQAFVTGFMDLVFRWRGKIYLLDWKTNVLPAYDRPSMELAMREAGYHMQYELYWEALQRWLNVQRAGGGMSLGGVIYVFLRGLSGADDASGVYFVPANEVGKVSRDG
jgi:exodeoxyribonuclease V beta subunit